MVLLEIAIHMKNSKHLNESMILVSVDLAINYEKNKAKLCRNNLLRMDFENVSFYFSFQW